MNSGLQKDCQEIEKSSTMLTLLSFGKLLKARDHHQFSSHRIEIKMRKKRRGEKRKKCGLFLGWSLFYKTILVVMIHLKQQINNSYRLLAKEPVGLKKSWLSLCIIITFTFSFRRKLLIILILGIIKNYSITCLKSYLF